MKKLLALLLLLCLATPLLTACPAPDAPTEDGPEIVTGDFDYMTSDLSAFITLPASAFSSLRITLTEYPAITDADVSAEFNSFFSEGGYYCPKADDDTVDTGDILYLSYHGVLLSVLEEAVEAGKIPDTACTGMSYSEILALSLGFSGGTTDSITPLTIGSAGYIDGFEDGLIGATVSASGEQNPIRLCLAFPTDYTASLAGKEVIFFCRLSYIGDKEAGYLSRETVTVERLNELLGLTDESAYPSLDACLSMIRTRLENAREIEILSEGATAVYTALIELADFPRLPDAALTACVMEFLDACLSDFEDLYESSPAYYAYLFGDETPSYELVAAYYGYSREGYMEEMKLDCRDAVKSELVYYYLLRTYSVTLSDAEIAAGRERYIALYGEGIFDGIPEQTVREQFLRDKIAIGLVDYCKDNGFVTYQTTTE